MSGPPPKPTALRSVEGRRGHQAAKKQEPDPDYLDDLTPPAWLPKDARDVWNNVAPKLRKARILTVADVEMLAMGCVSIAQYRRAVRKAGARMVIDPAKGASASAEPGDDPAEEAPKGASLNAWVIIQSMTFKQAMKVFSEFGMSPASRTRLAIQPQQDLFSEPSKRYFGAQ